MSKPSTESFPRSLTALPGFVWKHVCFPGKSSETNGPWRWPAFLFFLFFPGIILYPCTSFYLFEPDEGRYAQIPREMMERSDWIVPHLQGEPYLDKPPLFYWLVMGAFSIFGYHDWAARLAPALLVHLTVLITYCFGRRSLGERPAFWGALLLGLAPAFIGIGRLLVFDGILAFWVALAVFAAFEAVRTNHFTWKWWLLSAVACGLGILTKGPIALILLAVPLWLHRRLSGTGSTISWRAVFVYAGVMLIVTLPWYIAVCLRQPEFVEYFLWKHNVQRFVTPFDHLKPIWYYGPLLLVGLLPGTFFLIPFLKYLGTGKSQIAQTRTPALGFMLLAGGWCVLFFSLSGCKLPTYILPAFPFLCLAFGAFFVHSGWSKSRWTMASVAMVFGLVVVIHFAFVPWLAHIRSPMNNPNEVRAYCRDRSTPVVCYPRQINSVAFYLGRSDFTNYRSKYTPILLQKLQERPKTVVLFSHRHSLKQLRDLLPPSMRMVRPTKLGLCDMAIVEQK